jgi:DNA-binding MarR family transcriptional regulator
LETIEHLSNPTPTELSRELNISKPSVSVAIDKLVAAGYVRKVQSDEDRRSFHIHLTSKAGEVRRAHLQAHQQIAQILVHGLSELDLVEMRRLIAKILAANR